MRMFLLCLFTVMSVLTFGLRAIADSPPAGEGQLEGEEAIASPASITAEGRRALEECWEDPEPAGAWVRWEDVIPTQQQIHSIRIYRSSNLQEGGSHLLEECYLVDKPQQIQKIHQALLQLDGSAVTGRTGVTGYDAGDYICRYSLQISFCGKDGEDTVQRWDIPYDFETYLVQVTEPLHTASKTYDDIPYLLRGNRTPLTNLLDQLTKGAPTSPLDYVGTHPSLYLVDKKSHTFTNCAELPEDDADSLDSSYQSLKKKGGLPAQSTSQSSYFALSNGPYRLKLSPLTEGAAAQIISRDGWKSETVFLELANSSFFSQAQTAMKELPQHPSWLYPLLDADCLNISSPDLTVPSGDKAHLQQQVQKVLGEITVVPDSFRRVKKETELPDSFCIQIDSSSRYTIQLTQRQLLIQNDSVSYGALYQLEHGAQTQKALRQAMSASGAK